MDNKNLVYFQIKKRTVITTAIISVAMNIIISIYCLLINSTSAIAAVHTFQRKIHIKLSDEGSAEMQIYLYTSTAIILGLNLLFTFFATLGAIREHLCLVVTYVVKQMIVSVITISINLWLNNWIGLLVLISPSICVLASIAFIKDLIIIRRRAGRQFNREEDQNSCYSTRL